MSNKKYTATRKRPFDDWFKCVDDMLRSIGYKHKELSEEAWKKLYDENLSPFGAVNQSEFDGGITWFEFRSMQREYAKTNRSAPNPASLPAEPSTPETKDKPATGSAGGGEAVSKERFLREINHIVETGCNDIRLGELYDRFYPGQPTGTAYVRVAEKTDWVLGYYYRDAENKEMLMGECFLKPIQFMPEREGVSLKDAIALIEAMASRFRNNGKGFLKGEYLIDKADKMVSDYQTFLQSTGEGINE